jgi:hypothetical protein
MIGQFDSIVFQCCWADVLDHIQSFQVTGLMDYPILDPLIWLVRW